MAPLVPVSSWTARDGSTYTIRPIRPEDERLMVGFHQRLSAETVYARYLHYIGLATRTAHERLARVVLNDDREMALVAEQLDAAGEPMIVAVGRLSKSRASPHAEFAILVADDWQSRGLGTELLRRLVDIGRQERLELIWAEMLPTNSAMRRTAQAAGFNLVDRDGVTRAELRLDASSVGLSS